MRKRENPNTSKMQMQNKCEKKNTKKHYNQVLKGIKMLATWVMMCQQLTAEHLTTLTVELCDIWVAKSNWKIWKGNKNLPLKSKFIAHSKGKLSNRGKYLVQIYIFCLLNIFQFWNRRSTIFVWSDDNFVSKKKSFLKAQKKNNWNIVFLFFFEPVLIDSAFMRFSI